MIITINEHQHINNDYTCSFCEDEERPVVGRAYFQNRVAWPTKRYLFAYCARCGVLQAGKMASVVHPDYRAKK